LIRAGLGRAEPNGWKMSIMTMLEIGGRVSMAAVYWLTKWL
jgi:hypothetical protein